MYALDLSPKGKTVKTKYFTTLFKGILSTLYQLRSVFISKIIVDFCTDLHKMKINTELCCKRYDFLTKKTQNYRYQNYCLDDNIQIYSFGLQCEHVLSMRTV